MKNKNAIANAFPLGITDPNLSELGLTKFEYFATHAPENIPLWFDYEKEPKPESKAIFENLNPEEQEIVREWQHDPCYDLPEKLMWYQNATNDHYTAMQRWNSGINESRFFQWRIYYANKMCAISEPE